MSLSTTARDTVMSTPELLELLLAQLPMRDLLLRAPLVCKMWFATTRAPALQRALFFAPAPDTPSAFESTPAPVRNPLLAELFPPFFAPPPPNRMSWADVRANNRMFWPDARAIMAMPVARALAPFARRDASWRRMLVAQPPPRTLRVTERCNGRTEIFDRRAELRGLELRMGELYDLVLGSVKWAAASFCVTWPEAVGRESELTLETVSMSQYVMGIDEVFHGQGEEPSPEFGEWVRVGRAS
ncbi:hypothetical protein B0H15DRAFT_1019610 [Mycena belliarum]|uniref:F-box domain-containing protein n=1 Tax=Mycena belliarum TaxID=1033014 RepID=A0AAD6UBV8_9AGAR|nr:hypothetical protein B0H15DRAFT_1019610 [Mycena belliae]